VRRRLRRSPAAYWLACVALAALTGTLVAGLVRAAEQRAAAFGDLRSVPVARRSLPTGAVVRAADIVVRRMPAAFIPAGAAAPDAVGRTVVVPMVAGEVVLASKLAPGGRRGVTALLLDGERALAVPIGPGTPPLHVDDRVDVLATEPGEGDTVVVADGARVVGVDDKAVTVAVDVDDAPAVAAALANATVTLALAAL
jgi:Flp pilus assembly protein CpaB